MFLNKELPRGIKDFELGRSIRFFRELFDPKTWGEYKIELNRRLSVASFVLRFPLVNKVAFRVISVECPIVDDHELLDEASAYRMAFYYRREVKNELGDQGMVDHAVKRYGQPPKTLPRDFEGFYKSYRWEDKRTRIELGLGHQFDRLRFSDRTASDWFDAVNHHNGKKSSFGELF